MENKLVRCTKDHFDFNHVISDHNTDYFLNFFCFDLNSTIKPNLQGSIDSKLIYSSIEIYINICKNTTENNNHCQPYETIVEKVDRFYVDIRYTDIKINIRD
jgi:hypothetical protein